MPSKVRALGLSMLLVACSDGGSHARAAGPIAYGVYDASGIASWYGEEVAGNRTASGERFDPDGITVAHRSLPLGSFVEITSVESGRTILARVNDRGPGRKDRLVDLSHGAARLLGTDRRPSAVVRVRSIVPSGADVATLRAGGAVAARSVGSEFVRAASNDLARVGPRERLKPDRRYLLQVATFSNEARARALAARLDGDVDAAGGLFRVRLGPYKGERAQRARDDVAARGYGDAQILPQD